MTNKILSTILKLKLIMLIVCVQAHAQLYPVQVTPQIVPPYSVYLSDYATAGNEKLRVIILQRDLSRPAYQIRLVMAVEWNNRVIMRTARSFNPAPLNLDPGIPMVISGAELAPYLDSRNLDFVGYDRAQYERTKALPEGQYRISFTAYDYRRQDVQVSPEGNSFYYLAKSEPPLINYPACGTKISMKTPQQIVFSWMPRNTASPNSVIDTEYEFSLFETRPAGRNPNDVALSSQPVFRVRTNTTQLVYGPAEPMLLQDMTYVWRVQAIDRNGRDAFRNNGYSEVCTFYYGGSDANFDIGGVKDLQARGETKNRGKIWWTTGAYDGYRAEYKKSGQGHEWFRSDTKTGEIKIFDLEPDTEYEARVQAKKSGFFGPYSEIIKFRTLPNRPAQCGENPELPDQANPGNPLTDAITGMTINARGADMVLLQVTQLESPGWYKGYGQVTFDYFLGLSYGATFDRIFINDNREVVLGRIDVMSEGMDALIEEQIVANKEKDEEREVDETNSVITETAELVTIAFPEPLDSVIVNDVGAIVAIGENGGETVFERRVDVDGEPKDVIITDTEGNSFKVDKNGTVSRISQAATAESVASSVDRNAYYFTSYPDTTKYSYSGQLFHIKESKSIYIKLHKKADTLQLNKIYWKIDGQKVCQKVDSCKVDLSKAGTIPVEVYDDAGMLTKMKVGIYRKPVVVFKAGNNFDGEYGFDDGYKYTQLQSDYTKLQIDGTDYYVGWLTLLDQQAVNLKLDVTELKSDANNDKKFRVTIRSSSPLLEVNDSAQIEMSYARLKTNPTIKIDASSFSAIPDLHQPPKIEVLDHKGNVIGQLNVVCSVPAPRKVVFVYVDRGNGYMRATLTTQSILNVLNTKSHNQFYRRWEIDADTAFVDTLNISKLYKKNSATFTTSSSTAIDSLEFYYRKSLNNKRLKPNTHFFFITDIPISRPNASGGTDIVQGIANTNGLIGTIFNGGREEEVAHELGHNLNLPHTFDASLGGKQIPQGRTHNYMDYTTTGRDMFFLYQIKRVNGN